MPDTFRRFPWAVPAAIGILASSMGWNAWLASRERTLERDIEYAKLQIKLADVVNTEAHRRSLEDRERTKDVIARRAEVLNGLADRVASLETNAAFLNAEVARLKGRPSD